MSRRLTILALAGTLLLLLAHVFLYRFLCDDAFISFRYARNLAQGHGLVFNPGHERVEGYTNFLWVVVLAAADRVGIAPEHAAPALSILLTVGLWALVARASMRIVPGPFALFPPAALALTRSVAVWSTSGLETRLFEVLVVGAVLRLVEEVERPDARPWAALLFALAALTRPDGLLIAVASMGLAGAWRLSRRAWSWRHAISSASVFAGLVGAHFAFRFLYYGAWLPNTYYAKIGGRSWWGMGTAYLGSFAVEYAVVLWLPALVLGVVAFTKEGRGSLPAIFGAAVLPHALYVASIGGDHFEYRPLDLYFPFAFLLIARGLAVLAARRRIGAHAYAVLILVGLVALPWAAHVQFPKTYSAGYPGRSRARADRDGFLESNALLRVHRRLLDATTAALVGVRQEEHALFFRGVQDQGRALRRLVERGLLPADTHIGICAVGAIPYDSNLRTLDRLGLTDATVAHQPPAGHRVMAHERYASFDYAARAGVDLWSVHPYFLLLRLDDDAILWHANVAREDGDEVFVADVDENTEIVALLPRGRETLARFPALHLVSLADPIANAAFVDRVVAACRARLAREPASGEARKALAIALDTQGRTDEALALFRELAGSGDAEGWYNVGTILAQRQDFANAIDALRHAVTLDPTMVPARHNLGMALARSGRFPEALVELREAVRLEPTSPGALFALGVVALNAGEGEEVRRCQERLEALGTPTAAGLARRLAGQ
ncbi:MAG TPA: tetratricopeptide repeat protein [Candidatus Polarisedimenticolaceae bacterium]|nr:tetratricopeptide repeat protein [Candidatus Polarisedimenticolaceae bacterium]